MAQALSLSLREHIYDLRESGMPLIDISTLLCTPYGTIKQLCRRFRNQGVSGLQPSYSNCGSGQSALREQKAHFIALKKQHPTWGAPRLHLEQQLMDKKMTLNSASDDISSSAVAPSNPLASMRSLNRWYRQASLTKPRKMGEHLPIGRARAPHNIWEIDAKEQLILADGSPACYLTMVDEKSGAWLEAPVFPL